MTRIMISLMLFLFTLVFTTTSIVKADELVVTETGNVGIGVDTPDSRLQILGGNNSVPLRIGLNDGTGTEFTMDVAAGEGLASLVAGARIKADGNGYQYLGTRGASRISLNDGSLKFFTSNSTAGTPGGDVAGLTYGQEKMTINSTGNVGIGVTDPEQRLHVIGRVYFDAGMGGNVVNYNDEVRTYRYTMEGNGYNLLLRSLGSYPILAADRTNGTTSAPAPVVGGDQLFRLRTSGTNQNLKQNWIYAISVAADGDPVGDVVYQQMSLMANRVMIRASGNVGIGTTDPQYKLDVNGVIRAGTWLSSSDARWKESIEPVDDALDRVCQLRGISYEWIDKSRGEGRQLGVIAQEVEPVFPEVVYTDSQGYKSVEYSKLVAPLIEAVKVLKNENEALKERIVRLEALMNR